MEPSSTGNLEEAAKKIDELFVRCLLLRLHTVSLLVPDTVIAEVIEHQTAKAAPEGMPEWLQGSIFWRGWQIPVIRFEHLLRRSSETPGKEQRHVVCNTLNGNSRVPFVAMEVQSIPRLVTVNNAMLEHDAEEQDAVEPVVLAHLRLGGDKVLVPNIDVLENMLIHLGVTTDNRSLGGEV